MSNCLECGLGKEAWPHNVKHPAVTTRPEAHLFVEPINWGFTWSPKHREFQVGDIVAWATDSNGRRLRMKVVGFAQTARGTKQYEIVDAVDVWDTRRYLSLAGNLVLLDGEVDD